MYPVLMKHPNHGATHAYDSGEVARLKGYGWAEATKEAVVDPSNETLSALNDVLDAASAEPLKRKPGRPKGK